MFCSPLKIKSYNNSLHLELCIEEASETFFLVVQKYNVMSGFHVNNAAETF